MKLKTKPYGAPRKKRTPAQEVAQERAFRIFRLRGLWSQAFLLSSENRAMAQSAIDAEIVSLGAVPESVRHAEREAEFNARWVAKGGPDLSEPIPF